MSLQRRSTLVWFANSVDAGEEAHNERPHLDFHYLAFVLNFLVMI